MSDFAFALSVIGAGSYGTALAQSTASKGLPVMLWSRNAQSAATMQQERFNSKYLPNVKLSDNLKTIRKYAFYGCESLGDVILPKRIINIGKNILYGCYNIQKIEFPSVVNNNADFKNLGYLWRKDNSSFSLDNTKWLTYDLDSIYYCIPLSLKGRT